MKFFGLHKRPLAVLLVVLFSISLWLIQNQQFHVHSVDRGPVQHHDSVLVAAHADHAHITLNHLATDTSHHDHHDAVMLEMEASPVTVLQQLSNSTLSADLAALIILLFIVAGLPLFIAAFCCTMHPFPQRRFDLIPLRRAPPR